MRYGGYLLLLGLAGCATPAQQFIKHAATDFSYREITGAGFKHTVFVPKAPRAGTPLHIYLDGDGTPFSKPGEIAIDPSPREPLVLDLIARDPKPSVLIGRPCYYRVVPDPACAPAFWTSHRYSDAVVGSMVAAIETVIADLPNAQVSLIGYSGGGTLAMLIAPRLNHLIGVLTVAANLDITEWAAYHHFTPLTGSLNPADQPVLNPAISERHLYGGSDSNVPLATTVRFFAREGQTPPELVAKFDHQCCWSERWPEILAQFDRVAYRNKR